MEYKLKIMELLFNQIEEKWLKKKCCYEAYSLLFNKDISMSFNLSPLRVSNDVLFLKAIIPTSK